MVFQTESNFLTPRLFQPTAISFPRLWRWAHPKWICAVLFCFVDFLLELMRSTDTLLAQYCLRRELPSKVPEEELLPNEMTAEKISNICINF